MERTEDNNKHTVRNLLIGLTAGGGVGYGGYKIVHNLPKNFTSSMRDYFVNPRALHPLNDLVLKPKKVADKAFIRDVFNAVVDTSSILRREKGYKTSLGTVLKLKSTEEAESLINELKQLNKSSVASTARKRIREIFGKETVRGIRSKRIFDAIKNTNTVEEAIAALYEVDALFRYKDYNENIKSQVKEINTALRNRIKNRRYIKESKKFAGLHEAIYGKKGSLRKLKKADAAAKKAYEDLKAFRKSSKQDLLDEAYRKTLGILRKRTDRASKSYVRKLHKKMYELLLTNDSRYKALEKAKARQKAVRKYHRDLLKQYSQQNKKVESILSKLPIKVNNVELTETEAYGMRSRLLSSFKNTKDLKRTEFHVEQARRRIMESVYQSQIDLAERIHSPDFLPETSTLMRHISRGVDLTETERKHIRTIDSELLPELFKDTIYQDYVLKFRGDETLEEVETKTVNWITQVENLQKQGATKESDFLLNTFKARLRQSQKLYYPNFTADIEGATALEEMRKADFLSALSKVGNRNKLEMDLLESQIARMEDLGFDVTFKGQQIGGVMTPQAIYLGGEDFRQPFTIPVELSVHDELGIRGMSSSPGSINTLEIARRASVKNSEFDTLIRPLIENASNNKEAEIYKRLLEESKTTGFADVPLEVKLMHMVDTRLKHSKVLDKAEFDRLFDMLERVRGRHGVYTSSAAEEYTYLGNIDPATRGRMPIQEYILGNERVITHTNKGLLQDFPTYNTIASTIDDLTTKGVLTREAQEAILNGNLDNLEKLKEISLNVQDKKIGTLTGGAFTNFVMGGKTILTGERLAESGFKNFRVLSPESISHLEYLEDEGYYVYGKKIVSTREFEAVKSQLAKGTQSTDWARTLNFDVLSIDEDMIKYLKESDLDKNVLNEFLKGAKGHLVISNKLVPAFGHVEPEVVKTPKRPDIRGLLEELRDIYGEQALPDRLSEMGIYLGAGKAVNAQRGSTLELMTDEILRDPLSKEYAIAMKRKIEAFRHTKLFDENSGRARDLTRPMKHKDFRLIMEKLNEYFKLKTGGKSEGVIDTTKFLAVVAGKDIGMGSEANIVAESKHLSLMYNVLAGRNKSVLKNKKNIKEFEKLTSIEDRMRYLLKLHNVKNGEPLIQKLLPLFSDKENTIGLAQESIVGSPEAAEYLEQMKNIKTFLSKVGLKKEITDTIPMFHLSAAIGDVPLRPKKPANVDIATALKLAHDMPEVYKEILSQNEGLEEFQLASKLLGGEGMGISKRELTNLVTTANEKGKINLVTPSEFRSKVALTNAQFKEIMQQGASDDLLQKLNLEGFSNKLTVIDLGKENAITVGEDSLRYIPIMPRKVITNISAPYQTTEGAVRSSYDRILASIAASFHGNTINKDHLISSVEQLYESFIGKSGIARKLITGQFPSSAYLPVVHESMGDIARDYRFKKGVRLLEGENEKIISVQEYLADTFKNMASDEITASKINKALKQADLVNLYDESHNAQIIKMSENELKLPVSVEISSQAYQQKNTVGRNLYKDIMSGKIDVVGTDIAEGGFKLRVNNEELAAGIMRYPNISQFPLLNAHTFIDLNRSVDTENILKIGAESSYVHNMDFDFDHIVFSIFSNKKAVKQLRDYTNNHYLNTIIKVHDAYNAPGGTPFSMESLAIKGKNVYNEYLQRPEADLGARAVNREAWIKTMQAEAKRAVNIAFTGKATRLQERIYFGLGMMNPQDVISSGALKWAKDIVPQQRLYAGQQEIQGMFEDLQLMLEAIPQEAITPRKFLEGGKPTEKAVSEIESILRDYKDPDLLWRAISPYVEGKHGAAMFDKTSKRVSSIAMGKEAAYDITTHSGELTARGRALMQLAIDAMGKHDTITKGFNPLFSASGSSISKSAVIEQAKAVMQLLSNPKGHLNIEIGNIALNAIKDNIRGRILSAARVAGEMLSQGAKPAAVGLLAAGGIYAASKFASDIDRLDNRPEAHLRTTDLPPSMNGNLLPDPGYAKQVPQFVAPEHALPTPTARLNNTKFNNVVNVEYAGDNIDPDLVKERMVNDIKMNRGITNITYENAAGNSSYLEYKARKSL